MCCTLTQCLCSGQLLFLMTAPIEVNGWFLSDPCGLKWQGKRLRNQDVSGLLQVQRLIRYRYSLDQSAWRFIQIVAVNVKSIFSWFASRNHSLLSAVGRVAGHANVCSLRQKKINTQLNPFPTALLLWFCVLERLYHTYQRPVHIVAACGETHSLTGLSYLSISRLRNIDRGPRVDLNSGYCPYKTLSSQLSELSHHRVHLIHSVCSTHTQHTAINTGSTPAHSMH